ncbi:MAG: nucleoside deaminase [Spirochaetia bacterium]|jgi:tRNA(Arg) A34 adenosine deaminase TadA|nr:nucleoside deaminase [Spirochaetia bacterium]
MPDIKIQEKLTDKDIALLYQTVRVAHEALMRGCHPFGALLADKDGNILIEQGNDKDASPCLHAETALMIRAGKLYDRQFLEQCSMYTNFEPCVMCTGAVYWTGVSRIVYGVSEAQLKKLTGDHDENPTFSLSTAEVLRHGQRDMVVAGPTADSDLVAAILKDHLDFWKH